MKNKGKLKKEAMQVIINLFNLAKIAFKDDPKLANKYVKLARKNAM